MSIRPVLITTICTLFHTVLMSTVRAGRPVHVLKCPWARHWSPTRSRSVLRVWYYWYWVMRSGLQFAFQFIRKVLDGVEVWLSSSKPNRENHFFMELALCTGALPCRNRRGSSPNSCHRVGRTLLSEISFSAVALTFYFIRTERPSPNHDSKSSQKCVDRG